MDAALVMDVSGLVVNVSLLALVVGAVLGAAATWLATR